MHPLSRHMALVLLLVCVLLASAVAQETTAGIQGFVKDPTAAAVTKATVEVSGAQLIGIKKVDTDSAGYYRFANLPPGDYTITVTASGFRTTKRNGVKLETGRLPSIDFTLEVGTTSETVEVSGSAPLVDVTQSKVAVTVEEQTLNNMPKGRSFQSVIPFAPGARQEPLQSRRDDPTRANGFQIDGASDSENVYMVEGLNTTNIQDGGVGKNVPFEFVQEVQIKSSSFEAEYGGALGGVVNVIQKKGANNWHGSLLVKYSSDAFNANDQCGSTPAPNPLVGQQISCGLRGDPNTSSNSTLRTDQAPQYYIQKKDPHRILEPGFEIGGPLLKDRLWIFTSYIPQIESLKRTVQFLTPITFLPTEVRTYQHSYQQHNAMSRLDYMAFSKLRLFGSWQYGYAKVQGVLPNTPDSAIGQLNNNATTPPDTIRTDTGSVLPSSVYNFGGDWTPSSKMVITSRFGYFFNNQEDRGRPQGIRYLYSAQLNGGTLGLNGSPLNQAFANTVGFSNIGSNQALLFDAYKRKSFSSDIAYFVSHFLGTHNFKAGYAWNKLANDVLLGYNKAEVDLFYGQDYSVATDQAACNAIIAANVAQFGASAAGHCRGNAGYFIVHDGVDTQGAVTSNNHALYVQDAWTVGHGLTVNAGIRLDKEFLPPYSAGANSISFGFGDKVAPRIGAAYDLFRNGKVKLYGSYGKFFDIMKYSLPRGSFGGEYWHDCVYAMDSENFNTITPSAPGNHSCPASGPAPGVTAGRFIENVDFRKNILDPTDPGIDPNIKPMQQHEYVVGADWAINPNLGLEVRYSRKRLDQTIEDIGITDNLGFYIGNPGPNTFADLLHRTEAGIPVPQCATCPVQPKAIRNYDGVEVRLTRKASDRWYGSLSYTYSRLYGNYSGLTDTDITDGNGGRHSPNNHRAFDQPELQFDAHGNIIDGPLSTDRPHTLKAFGWYRLKWWGQETILGLTQQAFSGSPLSTCVPVVGTTSSCMFVEGRGNWVDISRDATGNLVSNGIERGKRTGAFTQTDFTFNHSFKVAKNHENQRFGVEWTVQNLLNQRNVLSVFNTPFNGTNQTITPASAATPVTGIDWTTLMTHLDYIGLSNSQVKTLSNRYGLPNLFQASRTMRFAVRYTF